MFRQRVRARSSSLALIGTILIVPVALAAVWYGLMTILLSLKVPSGSIDLISGYRTAFDFLAGIDAAQITPDVRLVAGLIGLAAALLFGWLAPKEIPRPYLTRGELRFDEDALGAVTVQPRAIERIAETAAAESTAVSSASGRYGEEDLEVHVHLSALRDVPETLRDVQRRVAGAIERHGVPAVPVSVTLTGFDQQQERESIR